MEEQVRKKRKIGKETQVWSLFERYFLDPAPQDYPLYITGLTKGQALNLSVGMNRCHVQHAEETGMPFSAMMYSAKPQEVAEDGTWRVEISTNYTRRGLDKPSKVRKGGGDWMKRLLVQAEEISPSSSAPTPESTQPEPDKMESLLDNFMKGEKSDANQS